MAGGCKISLWLVCVVVTLHVANSSVIIQRDFVEPHPTGALSEEEDHQKKVEKFYRSRKHVLNEEIHSSLGGDLKLSRKEKIANKIIMEAKEAEMSAGVINPYGFSASRHIFEVLDRVNQSKVFQFIQKLPKGGILHSHDTYICTADYAVALTYWPDLWQRTSNNSTKVKEFRFSRKQPTTSKRNDSDGKKSTWRLVKDVRNEIGAEKYDAEIRKDFTLFDRNVHPLVQYKDINDVWDHFIDINDLFYPIVTYEPIWKVYFKKALKDMLDDGVQYLEIRGDSPELYDLDGNVYDDEYTTQMYINGLEEFKNENPSFIGSKLIYCGGKFGSNESTSFYFDAVRRLYAKFPQFVAGFDLAGQEDKAIPLVKFAEQILQLPKEINLYFHAGETSWFGSTDENVIDAVLLGTRRVGHGYSLTKHPKVLDIIKEKDIAVEVNPISNQVLKLVDDMRNHPATILLSQNIPITISSDNLSLWEVSPLSHDFYYTFMGIASRHSDLRLLKKLAINSLQYSAMNKSEKTEAFEKWQNEWDKFIDDLVKKHE